MKQAEFENLHRTFWEQCSRNFHSLGQGEVAENFHRHKNARRDMSSARKMAIAAVAPQQYRCLCQHLAVAKSRRYTPILVDRLNQLVRQGYEILHAGQYQRSGRLLQFLFFGFPAVIQANGRFVAIAALAFVVPGLLMALACYLHDSFLYSLMDPAQIRAMESMYDPEVRKLGRERQSDSDLMMFGFYIQNNIGISFRCFASGLFFCLGSLYFLIFNGLVIGGVSGHLTQAGFAGTFYPFVIGHGAFELTAIVFSGAAGLKLGYALIAPGQYTRLTALQIAAREAVQMIYGSTLMLLIAAFVEAWWSSSTQLTTMVKITTGAVLWLLVLYYCFCSGRFSGKRFLNRRNCRVAQ